MVRLSKKWIVVLGLALVLVAGFVVFRQKESGEKIGIGSKDFTENILVSEIYAQALEANGFTVERKQALGGTPIIMAAMQAGEIDLYPEYTSTGIAMVLKESPEFDAAAAYEKVKRGFEENYDLIWLDMSEVNNSQSMGITKTASLQYGVTTLTDLSEAAPNLRLCATAEFEERPDGLAGLKERLGGFDFASVRVFDKGIKYEVLLRGEADVNVCFTTDAMLSKGDIIAIKDDVNFWPPYNLAPVIRGAALEKSPKIAEVLNKISAVLNTETMQRLNAQVDLDQKEYKEVAAAFIKEKGLGK